MAEETNLAEWGAGQIAGGAFSAVGSGLFGMALSGLGVGFPDATADGISALRAQLQMIETQIVGLKNEVADVINRVGIAEADNRRQNLNSIMDASHEASTHINDAFGGDLTSSGASRTKSDIMDTIRGRLVDQLSVIHMAAATEDDGIPLYNLLVQNLKGAHRFLSSTDWTAVKSFIDSLQSAQFVQFWLVAQYYRANGDSQSMIDDATNLYQSNIRNEHQNFQTNRIWEGVVADQVSGLMIYYGDCPYVDHDSAAGVISKMNANYAGDVQGWRLPTRDEVLGSDDTKGILSGYDSNDGTPAQWLKKHGIPGDMTGIHFWTSTHVPAPNESDYLINAGTRVAHIDRKAYEADYQKWQDGDPYYCVDSSNRGNFRVDKPAQAHVVAVRNPQAWERELLMPKDLISQAAAG